MCVSILAVNLMGPWRWPSDCFWRCLKACCPGSSGSSHRYQATLKIYQLKRKYLHRRDFTIREKVASFFIISTTCPKEFWKSEMCSPNNPTRCLFLSERDSQGFIFQQKHQLNNKVWGFNFSSTLWDFYNVLFLFWVTAAIFAMFLIQENKEWQPTILKRLCLVDSKKNSRFVPTSSRT